MARIRIRTALGPLLLGALLLAPGEAGGQTLGEDLRTFLAVYNTADTLAIGAWVQNRMATGVDAGAEARRWRRWYDVLGPLEYVVTTDETPGRLQAFAQGTLTKGWAELVLRPSRSEDGRLRNVALGMGLHPGLDHVPAAALPADRLPVYFASYLGSMASADLFSGTLLVARNGRVLFHENVGWENRGARIPVGAETRFNVGSVTKLFTATAILRLVQSGRLDLDAPVAPLLPNAPMELDPNLTVRHLLTHSGGLGRGAFDQSATYPRELMDVDHLLALTVAPAEFAPGEDVRYSNTGFMVLGKIIEAITSEDYFDHVTREVFDRAGMVASGFLQLDRDPRHVANGYTRLRVLPGDSLAYEWGAPHNTLFMDAVRGSPAGGSFHTAGDLLAFLEALRGGELLDATHTLMMLEDQAEIPMEPGMARTEAFGFGWTGVTMGGRHFMTRDGGSNGISARLDYDPSTGYEVVVLANLESVSNLVANHVWDMLLRLP